VAGRAGPDPTEPVDRAGVVVGNVDGAVRAFRNVDRAADHILLELEAGDQRPLLDPPRGVPVK